jgi:hypothetical protein
MKKVIFLVTLLLASYALFAFCQHCEPVDEPDIDPCSIAGWCGNGNIRAQEFIRVDGVVVLSPCSRVNGQACGAY